jgi:hypothetical protein
MEGGQGSSAAHLAAGRLESSGQAEVKLLYRLLDVVVEPDACARELTWICEHWDRVEEANVLRFNYGSLEGQQLALF